MRKENIQCKPNLTDFNPNVQKEDGVAYLRDDFYYFSFLLLLLSDFVSWTNVFMHKDPLSAGKPWMEVRRQNE